MKNSLLSSLYIFVFCFSSVSLGMNNFDAEKIEEAIRSILKERAEYTIDLKDYAAKKYGNLKSIGRMMQAPLPYARLQDTRHGIFTDDESTVCVRYNRPRNPSSGVAYYEGAVATKYRTIQLTECDAKKLYYWLELVESYPLSQH